jgi:hypothetical protein
MAIFQTLPYVERLYFVADYCFGCRALRRMHHTAIGTKRVVGGVTTLKEPKRYANTCADCETSFSARHSHYVGQGDAADSLDTLIAKTFPTAREVWAERLSLVDRLKFSSGSLPQDAQARLPLLIEPIAMLDRGPETFLVKGMKGFWAFGVIISCAIVGGFLTRPVIGTGAWLGLFVGLIIYFAIAMLVQRARIKREIALRIARAIAGLRPTEAELDNIAPILQQRGDLSLIRVKHVRAALRSLERSV